MATYTFETGNVKAVELALEAAVASNKRAINTSKRPEFTPVYEKEIKDLMDAKTSLTKVK